MVDPSPHTGSEPVPGTNVSIRWGHRGGVLELELETDTPDEAGDARVDAVVDVARSILADPRFRSASPILAAGHPAESWNALPEAVAEALGHSPTRLLLQLRRTLPVPADHPLRDGPTVSVRPIGPDDDDAWIRVNNRAFAAHPDQGRESRETLATRRAEPWYDPAGFLVADDPDRPGELSGFCWTKIHEATDSEPALGEIYVIGVDPSHRGEGLGPAFVLAGLDHLAGAGLSIANLYVEADNEPALSLYDRLGFIVHERRRVYAP